PWQSKRYWNETQEAAEDLHYNPVHPLLGQPVSGAVHPTWEAELSTAMLPFLGDHRVEGSVLVPGAVFIEMALAAGEQTYGSAHHSVENLTLRRALVLDDTCDPILRTTLDQDTGALEFTAFTATAGGDLKWTLTATAQLNILPRSPGRCDSPTGAGESTTIDGDEFYARTRAVGLSYGEAFQTITGATAGDGWATARMTIPEALADEVDRYRFHPALIDGAFQTLLGAPLFGGEANESPYLPVRIRQSAIYGSAGPSMSVHVRVVSATADEIESDITVTGADGRPLAVFNGFTVQSLAASSHISPERVDRGLYEVQWVAHSGVHDERENSIAAEGMSWLVFVDAAGVGSALAEQMRRRGQHVRLVEHRPVEALTEIDGGYAVNPRQPRQLHQLLETHLAAEGNLAGIVDCWPLDMPAHPDGEPAHNGVPAETVDSIGVFTVMHVVKALAERDTVQPRLYLITANAQPAPGTETIAVEQAVIWGLGRVVGHQELVKQWGGLVDIDAADDHVATAARICDHVLDDDAEDQIAIRGHTTFVPRLRPASSLSKAFPTRLAPDASYVVTGGAGALGRVVATYLAERGARHIALLSRSELPPRSRWPLLSHDHKHRSTVEAIRQIERLGARVTTASVDITDADQVRAWLGDHIRDEGRPVRGIVHAAGSVHDQLLVNMTEADFTKVMAPKVAGTRVLHNAFKEQHLDFFVMFGSAGSVIASPGQGNYAAANAFLDAFAHHRRAEGLPATTIGWGPWSVGMVEELKLEKIYAQRGIELITPAAGARILDRLINQQVPNVIAITADWTLARRVGLVGQLPPMFSELGAAEASPAEAEGETSVLDSLAACPEADRLDMVARLVRQIGSAVFDLTPADIGPDDALDDLGLDSMMAMDFRARIHAMFAVELPVLELLRGVSVNELAVRILGRLQLGGADASPVSDPRPERIAADEVDRLVEQFSQDELRALLVDLETQADQQDPGGTHA
ncbi:MULTISPECIES: type I polyketide synthase, partial [unclassified Mycobacterium]